MTAAENRGCPGLRAQVVEEYISQGTGPKTLAATFTFANDLVSQTRYSVSAGTRTPTTQFIQTDGFGSTRWLTNSAGAITDTIDYDAFGVEVSRTGTTAIEHLHRGERFDANIGFYDLRARLYNPANGRFSTQDSFLGFSMDPRSLHKYVAFNADPIQFSDPSGNVGVIQLMGGVGAHIGRAVSFLGTRAGVTAVAKFSGELAFEYVTGIPVLTSPRGIINAARKLRGVAGDLSGNWLQKFKAGHDFENLVRDTWGLVKNNTCFKHGRPASPPGCFIPDFLVTKAGRLVEVKTSVGAVGKEQFQEFIKIAVQNGQSMTLVFFKKPTPDEMLKLQRWALEVADESDNIMLSVIHVLD